MVGFYLSQNVSIQAWDQLPLLTILHTTHILPEPPDTLVPWGERGGEGRGGEGLKRIYWCTNLGLEEYSMYNGYTVRIHVYPYLMELGIAPICSSVPLELRRDTQNEARNLSEGAWQSGGEGHRYTWSQCQVTSAGRGALTHNTLNSVLSKLLPLSPWS